MQPGPQQKVYFIGIALPQKLGRQVSELQWQLREREPRLLAPILPHVTLLHPPSLQGIQAAELLPRVHEAAAHYLPLNLTISGIGFFGKRVCYLKVESLALESLQAHLVRLLPPDAQAIHYKRPYVPHVTMAQIYDPHTLDRAALGADISGGMSFPTSFTVSSVSSFTRILPRQYRPEEI